MAATMTASWRLGGDYRPAATRAPRPSSSATCSNPLPRVLLLLYLQYTSEMVGLFGRQRATMTSCRMTGVKRVSEYKAWLKLRFMDPEDVDCRSSDKFAKVTLSAHPGERAAAAGHLPRGAGH